jgi:ABC-2 type transport system permease protein
MIRDTYTVIWREMIHLLRGSRSITVILRYAAFTLIFGVIIPWQSGRAWLYSPLPLIYWAWLAVYLASAATTGSFARERELHTLETLLATRLPDSAILLGKILAGVIYGGGPVLVSLLFGQVVLLFKGEDGPAFYGLNTVLGGYLASLLAAFAIGALASFVSLKAQTSRQAQASLSLVILLFFLPLVIVQFLPAIQQHLFADALKTNTGLVVFDTLLLLMLLDLSLWFLARGRFQRNRLIQLV